MLKKVPTSTFACLFVSVASLALTGCGSNDDADSSSSSAAEQGTWQTGCVKDDSDPDNITYSTSEITFSGNEISGTDTTYSKAGCAAADASEVIAAKGTYTLNGTAHDTTVTTFSVTPKSDASVTQWKGLCADLTWTKGKATDLKSTSCGDLGKLFFATNYGLLEIKEGKLYLGKESEGFDGNSAATRFKELNTASPYTKK